MAKSEPRQYTMEEMRSQFLRYVRDMILYWHSEEYSKTYALEGMAFSILAALDGEASDLPSFAVLPLSTIEDQKYFRENGQNWYPVLQIDNQYDIAGSLHDHLLKGDSTPMERTPLVITLRELMEFDHALHYANRLAHGTTGHNQLMLLAKVAEYLGFYYAENGEVVVPEGVRVEDAPGATRS